MLAKTKTQHLYWIAIVVSLGGFVFGFDASVISGVVGYVSRTYHLTVWQEGWVVSAPTLAAIIGSFTVVPASDLIGRKRILVVVAGLYVVSAIGAAFATGFLMLVVARAIGGLAFASLMITPVYVAEVAPSKQRGLLVSINQMNIVVGLSAAYFSNYLLVALANRSIGWVQTLSIDTQTWRWMLGLEIVPAVLWLILVAFIPESPRWLIVKGRVDQARQILGRLFDEREVEDQLEAVQETANELETSDTSKLGQVFSKKLRYVLLIGFVVGIAQQITGINAVFFFATSIFEQSGVGTDAAFAQAVWVGLINVVVTIAAMLLIDRLGRRALMLVGLIGVTLSLSLVGWGFYRAEFRLEETAFAKLESSIPAATPLRKIVDQTYANDLAFKRAAVAELGAEVFKEHESQFIQSAIHLNPIVVLVGILGFVASFAISLGPVMWVVLSEIFPNHLRGVAMAVVGFVNAGVSFGVQFLFPWELANLGTAGTFFLYAAFGVIFFLLTAKILPETKGRTLEEIERQLTR